MPVNNVNFELLQRQFADHIRNPETPIIAGIEDRRMKIYRDLFFNNIKSFTITAFPVANSIMSAEWWQAAVRDFMIHHRCDSPYFSAISAEFLKFLTEVREPTGEEPDFLLELMHYEWVELALDIDEADPFTEADQLSENLLDGHPVQSPLAWSLSYRYAVHQISASCQPQEPLEQPCWLMVYRNRDDRVQFMELNAVTARLLHIFDQNKSITGRAALEQIALEIGHKDSAALLDFGSEILRQLYAGGILLGAAEL